MNISGERTARQIKGVKHGKTTRNAGEKTHQYGLFLFPGQKLLFVFLQFGLQLILQHVLDQRLHALR